jgi:hypothetical protein
MGLKWKLDSVNLQIVLILMQDRSTVCAKTTMGSEIVLDAPMVLLGDKAQVEARFGLFGDSANLDVILEAPDSSPRR